MAIKPSSKGQEYGYASRRYNFFDGQIAISYSMSTVCATLASTGLQADTGSD